MVVGPTEERTLAALPVAGDEGRSGLDLLRSTGLPSGALYPALVRLQRSGLAEPLPGPRRRYRRTPQTTFEYERSPNWLPALLAAIVTGYAVLVRPAPRLTDLSVYIGAVTGLREGTSLYDFISGNAPFTYPPFAGLVFLPLTWVPTGALQLTWTLATIAAVFTLATLITQAQARPAAVSRTTAGAAFVNRRNVPLPVLAPPVSAKTMPASHPTAWAAFVSRRNAPLLALVLMLSAPVSSDLKYGQVSVFLAVLVVADVLRASRWQGVLIGLAAAVKLTPLIFIPLLWFGGRRRAAALATATFAACAALAALVLPGDSWRFWTSEVTQVSRLGYITSVGNQSLNGALLRFDVPAPARSAAVLVIGGLVVLLALRRGSRLAHDGDWLSAVVLMGAAGIVFSPVSWTHHQTWLVLAALLPVRGPRWLRRAWPILVVAVMLLPVTALGPPLWSNARLLLAITAAALLPLARPPVSRSCCSR